jgi:iron complex outermembrane receptor protein
MFTIIKRSSIALVSVIVAIGAPAVAQDDASETALSEITVTAQRREQSVMDIPSALSVLSGDDIRDQLLTTSHDLELAVPGLTFHEVSGSSQVTLRGVGTGYAGPALGNSVAIYTDDNYISNQIGAVEVFYDMERVEVLKGPQPTLYGRNATGGTIQFITNKPNLDATAGYVEAGYSELDTTSIEGMFNLPLGDTFAVRLAGKYWDRGEGHVTNINTGDKITGENEYTRYRVQARFQPNDQFNAIFKYEYGESSGDEPLRRQNAVGQLCQLCVGGDDGAALGWYETDQTPQAIVDQNVIDSWGRNPMGRDSHARYREVDTLALNMEWAISDTLTLTSATQQREVSQSGGQDQDANFEDRQSAFGAKNTTVPGEPDGIVYKSLTQELRLTSESDGRFDFTAGLFFSDDDNAFTFGVGGSLFNPFTYVAPNFDDVESFAVYLEGYYDLTDDLTLTIGGRYTDDEVTHAVIGGPFGGPFVQTENFDAFTPRVALNYRGDWGSAYASFSKGFKAGGFNSPSFALQTRVEPEQIDAFEIGAKFTPQDNVQIDVALFNYDWKDLQIAIIDTGSLGISQENAAAAEVQGMEFGFRWAANEVVSMGADYTYLNGQYLNYDNASGFIPAWQAPGAVGDERGLVRSSLNFSGTRTAQTPENSFSADLTVNFDLSSNWSGKFVTLVSYSDEYDMIPGAGGPAQLTMQDSYTIVNLALDIENESGLSMRLYVDNATDEEYLFESQTTNYGGYQGVGFPRLFGVSIRKTW